ncbi:hypothetical protein BJ875DRAFT_63307 [Amylocarpus encephaloides]|uniref:Uncharacterized protein n=1 Tax=Amylocarpus encephaloides TaxID=45428 RepID=A0A9P7YR79_9HELO|nr:hypothetical protein BJ875DRAFT_63307 [Amylocarpus encephaloides]
MPRCQCPSFHAEIDNASLTREFAPPRQQLDCCSNCNGSFVVFGEYDNSRTSRNSSLCALPWDFWGPTYTLNLRKMDDSEQVICCCQNQDCKQELGRFRNSWIRIGKTYCSPMYPMLTYANGFEACGDISPAQADTLLAKSSLQDLRCKGCLSNLGFRCHNAPDGHILARDQLVLRSKHIIIYSESTGLQATISVVKTVIPKQDSMKTAPPSIRASTAQPDARRKSVIQKQTSDTPLGNPMALPQHDGAGLSEFKTWARNAVDSQRRDIERISRTLETVQSEMGSFGNFMEEVRNELKESRQNRENEIRERQALSKLVDELSQQLQMIEELNGMGAESSQKNLEGLLLGMQKVGNEVNILKFGLLEIPGTVKSFVEATITRRIQGLADATDEQLDSLDRQLDSIQTRLDHVSQNVDTVPGPVPVPNETRTEAFSRARTHNLRPCVEIPLKRLAPLDQQASRRVSRAEQHDNSDSEEVQLKDQNVGTKRKVGQLARSAVEDSDHDLPIKRSRGPQHVVSRPSIDNDQAPVQVSKAQEVINQLTSAPGSRETPIVKNIILADLQHPPPTVNWTSKEVLSDHSSRGNTFHKVASTNTLKTSIDAAKMSMRLRSRSLGGADKTLGGILTSSGKIERRFRKRELLNEPNRTPSQQVEHPKTNVPTSPYQNTNDTTRRKQASDTGPNPHLQSHVPSLAATTLLPALKAQTAIFNRSDTSKSTRQRGTGNGFICQSHRSTRTPAPTKGQSQFMKKCELCSLRFSSASEHEQVSRFSRNCFPRPLWPTLSRHDRIF